MYPSGTKESKYPLESEVEWWRRFTTGQEAVITTAEALYTHAAQARRKRRKNRNLKPENKREVDITFQPLHM